MVHMKHARINRIKISIVWRTLQGMSAAVLLSALGCSQEAETETADSQAAKVSKDWEPVEVVDNAGAPETPAPATETPAEAAKMAAAETQSQATQTAAAAAEEPAPATPAGATPPAPPGIPQTPPRLMEIMNTGRNLQTELNTLAQTLQATHVKALENQTVTAAKESLEAAALKEMMKIAPGIEKDWERLQELSKELEKSQELAQQDPAKYSAEVQTKYQEYQKLTEKIQPLQMKVVEVPEIKQLRDAFTTAIQAETTRLDPKTAELNARHQEILQRLQALQAEYNQLRQQAMQNLQAAPPGPQPPTPPQPPAPKR